MPGSNADNIAEERYLPTPTSEQIAEIAESNFQEMMRNENILNGERLMEDAEKYLNDTKKALEYISTSVSLLDEYAKTTSLESFAPFITKYCYLLAALSAMNLVHDYNIGKIGSGRALYEIARIGLCFGGIKGIGISVALPYIELGLENINQLGNQLQYEIEEKIKQSPPFNTNWYSPIGR